MDIILQIVAIVYIWLIYANIFASKTVRGPKWQLRFKQNVNTMTYPGDPYTKCTAASSGEPCTSSSGMLSAPTGQPETKLCYYNNQENGG